jgi:hypothetical protein
MQEDADSQARFDEELTRKLNTTAFDQNITAHSFDIFSKSLNTALLNAEGQNFR